MNQGTFRVISMVVHLMIGHIGGFLGAFAKFWKTTITFVMGVRSSVRMEQLGSDWKDFREIWYLSVILKYVAKIQASLKSNKNKEYFAWRPMYLYDNISLNSS
jgi:hypothetical protein